MPDPDLEFTIRSGDHVLEEEKPPAPGSAAVFQGIISVLGKELEALHQGMATIQLTVEQGLGDLGARLSKLEASTGENRAETGRVAARIEEAATATREHIAGLEAGVLAMKDPAPFAGRSLAENVSPALEDLNDRIGRLEEAMGRLVDQADLRATTLTSELHGVLAAGMERLASLAARADESTASDLRSTGLRVEAIASSVADLATDLAGVAEVSRRLADEGRARPVLEAIEAASREHVEVLATLNTSVTRRIDSRVRSIGEMIENLSADLGRHEAKLDALRSVANEPHDSDGGAAIKEAFAGIEASIEKSLDGVRAYLGDGLMHVSRRQAGTGKAMESATAALQSMERQLNALSGLCQSLASGVDQQTTAATRVADLLLETRSALRGDLDRVEATVHLEALKLHQQDQARLAGAASATTEVVEREAALLAQRVSAVATAVESVRTVLHGHVEDASRGAAAPLSLVKES